MTSSDEMLRSNLVNMLSRFAKEDMDKKYLSGFVLCCVRTAFACLKLHSRLDTGPFSEEYLRGMNQIAHDSITCKQIDEIKRGEGLEAETAWIEGMKRVCAASDESVSLASVAETLKELKAQNETIIRWTKVSPVINSIGVESTIPTDVDELIGIEPDGLGNTNRDVVVRGLHSLCKLTEFDKDSYTQQNVIDPHRISQLFAGECVDGDMFTLVRTWMRGGMSTLQFNWIFGLDISRGFAFLDSTSKLHFRVSEFSKLFNVEWNVLRCRKTSPVEGLFGLCMAPLVVSMAQLNAASMVGYATDASEALEDVSIGVCSDLLSDDLCQKITDIFNGDCTGKEIVRLLLLVGGVAHILEKSGFSVAFQVGGETHNNMAQLKGMCLTLIDYQIDLSIVIVDDSMTGLLQSVCGLGYKSLR